MLDFLTAIKDATAHDRATMAPVALRVVVTPEHWNPFQRLSVFPVTGSLLAARGYCTAVQAFLYRHCYLCPEDMRAMAPDLEAMIRGALLKVADGELDAPFTISREIAQSAIIE